jgi:Ca2+-binding RTX toxin-like protein
VTNQFRLPDDLKDTLAKDQWWLFNTGQRVANNKQTAGTPGIDLNVLPLWPYYTGNGIKVGVVDDGIDGNHEDFVGNFDQLLSLPDALGGPFPATPNDNHGTSVAGIIAAERNKLGTVGIAYNAAIAGYKFSDINGGFVASLTAQDKFDVSNNSWGYTTTFPLNNDNPGNPVESSVIKGRNGLGTVFAWAGGNSREEVNPNLPKTEQRGKNVNYDSYYENSRYVIAVAAIDNKGVFAPYSNPGAPLLVSAFGDRPASIATVDRTGNPGYNTDATAKAEKNFSNINYHNGFNGTSSASPMVAGVAALILQANPKLGYRDVQEILAYSARKTDSGDSDWKFNGAKNWNGGRLHINHNYGFGLVDATAAVRLAENWQLQSGTNRNEAATHTNEKVQVAELNLPTPVDIPDNDPAGIEEVFHINQGINIDKLELDLDIEHGQFQDLVVKLISPDKTESIILDRVPYYTNTYTRNDDNGNPVYEDLGFKGKSLRYTFSSTRDWGETGIGNWTLNISDNSATNDPLNTGQNDTSGNNIGKLKGATLRLYGDNLKSNNTYIYTNEFASFTTANDDRKTLNDTDGGNDTINVAAITDDIIVNLNPGATSTLPGRTVTGEKLDPQVLTIAPDSTIENLFAGDGNDSIVGNQAANILSGGRGNDTLIAVDSPNASSNGDTLLGGGGSDLLIGGIVNTTTYILDAQSAAGSKIKSANGSTNNLILNNAILTKNLTAGQNGIARQGNDLLIDLNADGKIESRSDLTIENFFLRNSGRFQNVGNLLGSDILSSPPAASGRNVITVPTSTPSGIFGTGGDDAIAGSLQNDNIDGLGGDDEIFGNGGNDFLSGNNGDDYLNGGEGDDTLAGSGGNDTIDGESGNNLLAGADGDDIVFGGSGADTIVGDDGDDSLFGDDGNDSISGGGSDDVIDGGDGNDIVDGSDGNDILGGGLGNDRINGGLGNDELYGDGGNDTIQGGGGSDRLFGGTGNDSYLLNSTSARGDIIADDSGTDSLSLSDVTLAIGFADGTVGVERGGDLNTDLHIDLNRDGVFTAADDLLILKFFAEPNLEQGDGFIEQVGNLSGVDILRSFPLNATTGDDFIQGGSSDDNIDGLDGNDTIDGNQGNDFLFGNAGDDLLQGDELNVISEAGGTIIQGTGIGNDYLDGGEGSDSLDGGEGDDILLGGAGDDVLRNGKGNDIINGGDGDDFLYGDEGIDSMFGGNGSDRFILGDRGRIYYSGNGNAVIADFNTDEDTISLSGNKANYSLSVSGNVSSIFLKRPGQSDDLIAIVQGVTDLNLDLPYFSFG